MIILLGIGKLLTNTMLWHQKISFTGDGASYEQVTAGAIDVCQ
jgi:hypothetical protein